MLRSPNALRHEKQTREAAAKTRNPFVQMASITKRAVGCLSRPRSGALQLAVVPSEATHPPMMLPKMLPPRPAGFIELGGGPEAFAAHESEEDGMFDDGMDFEVVQSFQSTASTAIPEWKRQHSDSSQKSCRLRSMITTKFVAQHKETIRQALLQAAGTPVKAFQLMDLNGSGSVSLTEFFEGLRAMRIDWKALTGLNKQGDLLALFDTDKNGAVDLEEMFPESTVKFESPRLDTPEWWTHWCKRNRDVADTTARAPKWHAHDLEDMMSKHAQANVEREDDSKRRRWISEHYRLLREDGRDTRQCREWIAQNLPASSQKARADVKNFTRSKDVTACRQMYHDQIGEPVQKIATAVHTLREQRKELQASRKQLWSIILEPLVKAEEEEEKRRIAADALQGLGARGVAALRKSVARPAPLNQTVCTAQLSETQLSPEVIQTVSFAPQPQWRAGRLSVMFKGQ